MKYYNIDIDRRYIKEKNVEKGKGYTSVAEEGERGEGRVLERRISYAQMEEMMKLMYGDET